METNISTTTTTTVSSIFEELTTNNSTTNETDLSEFSEAEQAHIRDYQINQDYYVKVYSAVFRESLKVIGFTLDKFSISGISEETKNIIVYSVTILIVILIIAALQFWNLYCSRQGQKSQKKQYNTLQQHHGLRM